MGLANSTIVAAATILALAVTAPAQTTTRRLRVVPRDESTWADGFPEFLIGFRRALAARDADAIVAILHPDIRTNESEGPGPAAFRKVWNLDSPSSEFWTEAAKLLQMGGSLAGTCGNGGLGCAMVYPYAYAHFPSELDAAEYEVVIGKDVPVHASPRAGSAVIGRLSYDVVRDDNEPRIQARVGDPFNSPIITPDGRRGLSMARCSTRRSNTGCNSLRVPTASGVSRHSRRGIESTAGD